MPVNAYLNVLLLELISLSQPVITEYSLTDQKLGVLESTRAVLGFGL